jgi:hypothetical protein
MALQTVTKIAFATSVGETLEQYALALRTAADLAQPFPAYGYELHLTGYRGATQLFDWTLANDLLALDLAAGLVTFPASSDVLAAYGAGDVAIALAAESGDGASHVLAAGTWRVRARVAALANALAPPADPQATTIVPVALPAGLAPFTAAAPGVAQNTIVYEAMNSTLWAFDSLVFGTAPARGLLEDDPAMPAPDGVKAGESYAINSARTSATSRLAARFWTPPGCTHLDWLFYGRRDPTDETTETFVLALYEADGTTLVGAAQPVTLSASDVTPFALSVDVSGDTEYVLSFWTNNAALGTAGGGGGGTSASGHFSRCQLKPSGADLDEVFQHDFVAVTVEAWENTAAYVSLAAPPQTQWPDPAPALTYAPPGSDKQIFGKKINFDELVVECRGSRAVVEYIWQGVNVPVWGAPIVRTAPAGATRGDQADARRQILPIFSTRPTYGAVATDGDGAYAPGELRQLIVSPPQTGRIRRVYVPAYAGTRVVPAPASPRRLLVLGDSKSVAYQVTSAAAPFELLRDAFDGQVIMYAAGGTALYSYGYSGTAGVLDPSRATVRDQTTAIVVSLDPAPTELYVQVSYNDYALLGSSKDSFKTGLGGLCDWWHGLFPAATVWLEKMVLCGAEGVANAGGATPADLRVAMDEVAATRAAYVTVLTPPAIELNDEVHFTAHGYRDQYAPWLISVLVP